MLSLNNTLLHHSLVLLFCLIFIIFIIIFIVGRHFNISEKICSEYAFLLQLTHLLKYVCVSYLGLILKRHFNACILKELHLIGF